MNSIKEQSYMTPIGAYCMARKTRPSDLTRHAASNDPQQAFFYAFDIDEGPHEVTRNGACKDGYRAWCYAKYIDKYGRQETRNSVCRLFRWRQLYAFGVDKWLHPDIFKSADKIQQDYIEEKLEFD